MPTLAVCMRTAEKHRNMPMTIAGVTPVDYRLHDR